MADATCLGDVIAFLADATFGVRLQRLPDATLCIPRVHRTREMAVFSALAVAHEMAVLAKKTH